MKHTEQEVRELVDYAKMYAPDDLCDDVCEMLAAYADLIAQLSKRESSVAMPLAAVPDETRSTLLILRDSFHTIQANHGAIWDCSEQIALIEELLAAAPQPSQAEPGRYKLNCELWLRESTDEWVLEIQGVINNTDFTCRHAVPSSVPPQDVAGLDHLYESQAEPQRAERVLLDEHVRGIIQEQTGFEFLPGELQTMNDIDLINIARAVESAAIAAKGGE